MTNEDWNERLHKEFNDWGEKNNLELESAELMLMWNIDAKGTQLTEEQSKWLNTFCKKWKKEKRFVELSSYEREDAELDILSMPELGKCGVNEIMGDFFSEEIIYYLTVSEIKDLIKLKIKKDNENDYKTTS